MKKSVIVLVFLLVLPIFVSDNSIFNSEYLLLNLDISSKINLVSKGSQYDADYVIANLSFIPMDDFQTDILGISTSPEASMEDNAAIFRWDNPSVKELEYSLTSNLRNYNRIKDIESKVLFPLSNLPDEIKKYAKPSETIDSTNKDIVRLASELAKGEDDLYVVVFKLADWTKKNIKYDLSTLTESVSQPASWVLTNKQGVCDELTNLFIAMCRALGIPAKFVSGVSYTNAAQFEEGFGPHGWSEVYFPGYGWIAFDVTYGEFGFVDAGHIKLKEGVDAKEASTKFQWLGRDINIETYALDIDVVIEDKKGDISSPIDISARAVKNNIGFGSYNLIEATVSNIRNSYIATELILSRSKEVEIVGEERKTLLLKPKEEKKVNWIIKVSNDLEEGYVYTFPLVVSSVRNISSDARFDVIRDGKRFSLEGIKSLIEETEEEQNYEGDIELSCSTEKAEVYEYETAKIDCDVSNIGNIYLEDLNICLDGDCEKIDLGLTQKESVSFDYSPTEIGMQEVVIKAINPDVSKSTFVDLTVYDKPSIGISDIVYPEEIGYKDDYDISFVLNKKSKFAPQNIGIQIEPIGKEFEVSQLNEDRKFVLKMQGNDLKAGENEFMILIKYKDKNDKTYEVSEGFDIELINVGFFQRISIFFKGITRLFN